MYTITILFILTVFIILGIFGLGMLFCLRKVPLGSAGVRVGFRGFIITDTWILRIPLLTRVEMMDITVQKLVIERKGNEGLLCQDNIRADIVAAFYIKVNYPKVDYGDVEPDSPEGQRLFEQAMKSGNQSKFDDILEVAQTVVANGPLTPINYEICLRKNSPISSRRLASRWNSLCCTPTACISGKISSAKSETT